MVWTDGAAVQVDGPPDVQPLTIDALAARLSQTGGPIIGRATIYAQAQRSLAVDTVSGATPISDNGGGQSGGLLGISRELVDEQFELADALGSERVPSTLVVDRSGSVRYSGGALDGAALEALRAAIAE